MIRDPFTAYTENGEQPDAIGWRDGLSFLIECKVSRADFLADKKKSFRADPAKGMGDWRFYMCPPDIIQPEDLPDGWGLLWVHEKRVQKVTAFPGNCAFHTLKPFEGNKVSENMMLVSALRRLAVQGHLAEIYENISPCADCGAIDEYQAGEQCKSEDGKFRCHGFQLWS